MMVSVSKTNVISPDEEYVCSVSSRKFLPTKVRSPSTIWNSVALPGILYATDVIPISENAIQELESIQLRVGKSTLGVPQSTANPVVYLELGWKPLDYT